MRKFADYPIAINYNLHTRLRWNHVEDELHNAKKFEQERNLYMKVSTSSDSQIKTTDYKPELEQYEKAVYEVLRKIEGNPVGRTVLGLLNRQTTVWIIPKSGAELKQCYCAQTNPLKYDIPKDESVGRGSGSGDTVIQFAPELGDETLLHELVHAYRYSFKKYHPMIVFVQEDRVQRSHNTEEFLAHQIESIYLSQCNRPMEKDYRFHENANKSEIYDFLVSNVDLMESLKFFLRHEYLAMLAAHGFATDYNPFRDFPMLEARWEKEYGAALPELGTVGVSRSAKAAGRK